jgi:hypothetical protein
MVSVSALPGLCSKFHKIDIIPGGVCEVNSLRHAPLQRAAMCLPNRRRLRLLDASSTKFLSAPRAPRSTLLRQYAMALVR